MATPAAAASATTICSSRLGELRRALLLGQVEVAEDLVADADRYTEEAAHRRVVGREPVRLRRAARCRACRTGRGSSMSRPSTPWPVGRSPMRAVLGVADAVRDELDQRAVTADDAERAVAGADQPAGRHHDALQGAGSARGRVPMPDDRGEQRGSRSRLAITSATRSSSSCSSSSSRTRDRGGTANSGPASIGRQAGFGSVFRHAPDAIAVVPHPARRLGPRPLGTLGDSLRSGDACPPVRPVRWSAEDTT